MFVEVKSCILAFHSNGFHCGEYCCVDVFVTIKNDCGVALTVYVHNEDFLLLDAECIGEVDGSGSFSYPTLEIENSNSFSHSWFGVFGWMVAVTRQHTEPVTLFLITLSVRSEFNHGAKICQNENMTKENGEKM